MSTPNINCILQAVLAVQNNLISPAPQIATFDLGNPIYPGQVLFYEPFFQATVAGTPIPVPAPFLNVFLVVIQNLSATSKMNVQVTPNGGGPQTTFIYGPNGIFLYFDSSGLGGISQLTVFGIGSTIPASVLVSV